MELPWCCCWGSWVNSVPSLPLCLTQSWERCSAPCLVWLQQWDCPTCSLSTSTPPGTSLSWASRSSLAWCCRTTSNRTHWSPVSARKGNQTFSHSFSLLQGAPVTVGECCGSGSSCLSIRSSVTSPIQRLDRLTLCQCCNFKNKLYYIHDFCLSQALLKLTKC